MRVRRFRLSSALAEFLRARRIADAVERGRLTPSEAKALVLATAVGAQRAPESQLDTSTGEAA